MKKTLNIALPVLILGLLTVMLVSAIQENAKPHEGVEAVHQVDTPATPTVINTTQYDLEPKTLNELLSIPAYDLDKVDIARMNLLCATDMPGTEDMDIAHALATLDKWAKRVAFETDRHLYRVTDPRYADYYHNSEAYFRAEMLLQVLQIDLGIKYDMSALGDFSFKDSRTAFLHGMIPAPGKSTADTTGGTCVSMPVAYVAVGRRLGYPLKLVTTDSHVFIRWDGKASGGSGGHPNPAWRERFNIEGTGEGFGSYEDDYYKTWPVRITDHQVRVNGYLLSLSPMEELAQFLAARGHCGLDNGEGLFAARCYENAHRYDPRRPCYVSWFADAARRSGYRPTGTESLMGVANQRQAKSNTVRRPVFDPGMDIPLPSETSLSDVIGLPPASRVGTWSQPKPSVQPTLAQQPYPGQPLESQP